MLEGLSCLGVVLVLLAGRTEDRAQKWKPCILSPWLFKSLDLWRFPCHLVFIDRDTGSERRSDLPKVTQHSVAEFDHELCLPSLLARGLSCCGGEYGVDSRVCYFS